MNSQDQAPIKIMVITKDPAAQASAAAILGEAGFDVHCTSDGQGWTAGAQRLKPDLVLTDTGSNGIAVLRSLKADPLLRRVPVVLMVADFNSEALEDALQSGAADCIRKPLDRVELRWRIDRLTQPRPSRAASKEASNDAQKYKEILETAAEVCHKLNQPLQYVMGTVQFLLMDMSTEDKLFDRLDMVRQKAELMGEITRKLTALTRHGAQS